LSDEVTIFDPHLDELIRRPKRSIITKEKESEIINVAFYRRVSTREQADEGQSLQAQKAKIVNYLKYESLFQGKKVKEIDFVDEGKSGKDLKRLGLQKLIESIKKNQLNYVIVVKLDRLTRRLADLQHLTDLMERKNVTLLSINEKLDTQSATGRFFLSILGSLAQLEREQVSERVQDVFEQIVTKQPLGGYAPFGYIYVNKTKKNREYIPYTFEYCYEKNIPPLKVTGSDKDIWPGEYARLIFEWFLTNPSFQSVAKKLIKKQIPTPQQIHKALKQHLTKPDSVRVAIPYIIIEKPKKWNRRTLQKIIENPFYTGTRVWNRYENRLKRERPSDQWKVVQNAHPKIITAEYYQKIHSTLLKIRRNYNS
jgi:site-specific DNA recombinase